MLTVIEIWSAVACRLKNIWKKFRCKLRKCEILKDSKTIAIVGISSKPERISRSIANYLVRNGFNVVGVNPNKSFTEADGIKVYNSLTEIPHTIDIVDVFRKSEDIPSLVGDVIKIKPKAVWLQLGIRNDESAEKFRNEGIIVFQDSCIKIDHGNCN
jgi:predicted CoA-binding protein